MKTLWYVCGVLLVLVLVVFLGWGLGRQEGISKIYSPKNTIIEVDSKADIFVPAKDEIAKLAQSIPVVSKPGSINISLELELPDSIEKTFATLPATTFGVEGQGAACGFPQYSKDNKEVSITFYANIPAYVNLHGKEKALSDINKLLKYCLAYLVLDKSFDGVELSREADYYASQFVGNMMGLKL